MGESVLLANSTYSVAHTRWCGRRRGGITLRHVISAATDQAGTYDSHCQVFESVHISAHVVDAVLTQ